MNKIYFLLFFISVSVLQADVYKLGRGYELYKDDELSLALGGHMDSNLHTLSSQGESVQLGQAGIMLSGEYRQKIRFLVEVGSDDIVTYNITNNTSQTTPIKLMRLYAEYLLNDAFEIKAGQFLTPIGIWNKTYIPALRWSNFTPYVAKGFFPKIIAGASLNGRVLDSRALSYSIFYHVDGEHDTNDNNVKAKEFIGGELRYHFSPLGKIALPFGAYRSDSSQEIIKFGGLNFLLPYHHNELSSEFLYKDGTWTNNAGLKNDWKDYAWYVQYIQHLNDSSYLSFRYGEERRISSSSSRVWKDENIVTGYIYRPVSAFSTKLEYRHRKRSGVNALKSDEALLSFSVLF